MLNLSTGTVMITTETGITGGEVAVGVWIGMKGAGIEAAGNVIIAIEV